MEWILEGIVSLGLAAYTAAAGLTVAALAAAVGLGVSKRRAQRRQAWLTAVREAGLTDVVQRGILRPSISGLAGPLRVRIEHILGIDGAATRILVDGFRLGKPSLSGTNLIRHLRDGEVTEHDLSERDRAGESGLALTILGAETRRRLGHLLQGYTVDGAGGPVKVSASLVGGLLEVQLVGSGGAVPDDAVPGTLVDVLAIARRLVLPEDMAERLAENLRDEPEAPLYLRTLELLDREPRHPATREILLAACRHPSSEVRLQVAKALGEEGHETLLALLTDAAEDSARAGAVQALGDRLPVEPAEAALRRALSWKQNLTVRACLDVLERRGGPGSEALLLQALGSEDAPSVAAAARCLGRLGTVAAIASLREVEATWRGEPGSAAHHAVLEIQARLIGAEAGQLTLAGGEAGALSFAGAEPGRLSLPADEADDPGAGTLPSSPPPAAQTS